MLILHVHSTFVVSFPLLYKSAAFNNEDRITGFYVVVFLQNVRCSRSI